MPCCVFCSDVFQKFQIKSASVTIEEQEWVYASGPIKHCFWVNKVEHIGKKIPCYAAIFWAAEKQGIVFPLKLHVGPKGYCLPSPQFSPKLFSSPTHSVKVSKPNTHSSQSNLAAKMIAHRRGFPSAAVKPRTMKIESFIVACYCALPLLEERYFSLSPSCFWFILHPNSSTKISKSGWISSNLLFNPKDSSSDSTTSSSAFLHKDSSWLQAIPAVQRSCILLYTCQAYYHKCTIVLFCHQILLTFCFVYFLPVTFPELLFSISLESSKVFILPCSNLFFCGCSWDQRIGKLQSLCWHGWCAHIG